MRTRRTLELRLFREEGLQRTCLTKRAERLCAGKPRSRGGALCGLWRTGPGELERGDQIRREICNLFEKRREEMFDYVAFTVSEQAHTKGLAYIFVLFIFVKQNYI